jgi:hypothetical protein
MTGAKEPRLALSHRVTVPASGNGGRPQARRKEASAKAGETSFKSSRSRQAGSSEIVR